MTLQSHLFFFVKKKKVMENIKIILWRVNKRPQMSAISVSDPLIVYTHTYTYIHERISCQL